MHGRRYFEKALTVGAKAGQTLAEAAMKFYKRLYDHEEDIRSLPPDERHRLRQEIQVPIWDEFKIWADSNHSAEFRRNDRPYPVGMTEAVSWQ